MVTENLFETIYKSHKYIKKMLVGDEGFVFNLKFPGHKWKFLSGGQ